MNSTKNLKVGMISLGCPKTLVDSEIVLGKAKDSFDIVTNIEESDIVLLNTCTFIESAKEESIDYILKLIDLKKQGEIQSIVVMGCLVQRYPKELESEFKEVDAFIGSGDYDAFQKVLEKINSDKQLNLITEAGYLSSADDIRVALTPDYSRYIKISEGCDHICSFCTIPQYRGKHRSRAIDDIVKEAHNLVSLGAKEIILTGQDTSYFGRDLGGKFLISDLLKELDQIDGIKWLRLLYAYPSCIDENLMKTIQNSKKICHYLDMPLQHSSDAMLTAMRRGITKRRTMDLIRQFHDIVEDLVMRTTFIVGFPGETDEDFADLLGFLEEMKFSRVGIFKYSDEETSHAVTLPNKVSDEVKEKRFHEAMSLQQEISHEMGQKQIGRNIEVLIESKDPENENIFVGRSYMDAPEIDGQVIVESSNPLKIGEFYSVDIHQADHYDLYGKI